MYRQLSATMFTSLAVAVAVAAARDIEGVVVEVA